MRSEFSELFNKQENRFQMIVLYCDYLSFNTGESRGAKLFQKSREYLKSLCAG